MLICCAYNSWANRDADSGGGGVDVLNAMPINDDVVVFVDFDVQCVTIKTSLLLLLLLLTKMMAPLLDVDYTQYHYHVDCDDNAALARHYWRLNQQ